MRSGLVGFFAFLQMEDETNISGQSGGGESEQNVQPGLSALGRSATYR
jgi:hypothetical protein